MVRNQINWGTGQRISDAQAFFRGMFTPFCYTVQVLRFKARRNKGRGRGVQLRATSVSAYSDDANYFTPTTKGYGQRCRRGVVVRNR